MQERSKNWREDEQHIATNKILATYIQQAMEALPIQYFPATWDFDWSRYSQELSLNHPTVEKIKFFNDSGRFFFKQERFGMMIDYSPTTPENFIEYIDYWDSVRIAKRIWSRISFSLAGESEMAHDIEDRIINGLYKEPRGDLGEKQTKNFLTPVPFDDLNFQERMCKIRSKPTAYDYGGGYVIDITIKDQLTGSWSEYIFDLLNKFSIQYTDQVPSFHSHVRDWYKSNLI